jgi:hypothetical protein
MRYVVLVITLLVGASHHEIFTMWREKKPLLQRQPRESLFKRILRNVKPEIQKVKKKVEEKVKEGIEFLTGTSLSQDELADLTRTVLIEDIKKFLTTYVAKNKATLNTGLDKLTYLVVALNGFKQTSEYRTTYKDNEIAKEILDSLESDLNAWENYEIDIDLYLQSVGQQISRFSRSIQPKMPRLSKEASEKINDLKLDAYADYWVKEKAEQEITLHTLRSAKSLFHDKKVQEKLAKKDPYLFSVLTQTRNLDLKPQEIDLLNKKIAQIQQKPITPIFEKHENQPRIKKREFEENFRDIFQHEEKNPPLKETPVKLPEKKLIPNKIEGFKVENLSPELINFSFEEEKKQQPQKKIENFTVQGISPEKIRFTFEQKEVSSDLQAALSDFCLEVGVAYPFGEVDSFELLDAQRESGTLRDKLKIVNQTLVSFVEFKVKNADDLGLTKIKNQATAAQAFKNAWDYCEEIKKALNLTEKKPISTQEQLKNFVEKHKKYYTEVLSFLNDVKQAIEGANDTKKILLLDQANISYRLGLDNKLQQADNELEKVLPNDIELKKIKQNKPSFIMPAKPYEGLASVEATLEARLGYYRSLIIFAEQNVKEIK